MGDLYYDVICQELEKNKIIDSQVVIAIPRGETSKAVGQKKRNVLRFKDKYNILVSFVEDDSLSVYKIKIMSYIPKGRLNKCT